VARWYEVYVYYLRGAVWCSVVQCGAVWCSMVLCDERCSVVQSDAV